jgi:hypothetical protein
MRRVAHGPFRTARCWLLLEEAWAVCRIPSTAYAEYHESLLRRIAAAAASTPTSVPNKIKSMDDNPDELPPPATKLKSYPSGCVLFTRHVLSDTNKTTLRAHFST